MPFFKGLIFALFIAVITVIYVLVFGGFTSNSLHSAMRGLASFGCLGFLLGGILAFDKESKFMDRKGKDRPFTRIAIGIVACLIIAFIWDYSIEGYYLAGIVGGILGYLGNIWAKYAQF